MGVDMGAPLGSSGFPSPADEYLEKPLDLNARLVANPEATFFMRVAGCGMEQRGIYDGDMLIVDKSLEPRPGLVFIATEDGEFVLREMKSGQEVADVWGVVVYNVHRL